MTVFLASQLFLCVTVSLDSFGAGISYGIRRIHLPFFCFLIIMASSSAMVAVSMLVGEFLSLYLFPELVDFIGGCILVFLGLFSLYPKGVKEKEAVSAETARQKSMKTWTAPLSVIKNAQKADLDQSGSISGKEAVLLGTALSLDAFGAGLGAAIIGYPPVSTAVLIGGISPLFLFAGIKAGTIFAKKKGMEKLAFLPPCLLIFIGISYML